MATTPADMKELVQTDDLIEWRCRVCRVVVAVIAAPLLVYIGFAIGNWVWGWIGLPTPLTFIGNSLGIGAGLYVALMTWAQSFIRNDATVAFVTLNPIASFLGRDPLVSYGPGSHFCYPWEQRSKDNTVNLTEMAVAFHEIMVQCSDGEIKMRGSTRLRADITRLPQFISGAAAVASDVTGLMISESVEIVGPMNVLEAVKKIKEINEGLSKKFKHGGDEQSPRVTDFEKRFGVIVGDTTIEEILPASEISETMGAKAEMAIIDEIVAAHYGKKTMVEVEEMIQAGKVTRAEVDRATTRAMAASGNLQGMDLRDHNFTLNVTGLDQLSPEAASAIAAGLTAGSRLMRNKQGGGSNQTRPSQPKQGGTT